MTGTPFDTRRGFIRSSAVTGALLLGAGRAAGQSNSSQAVANATIERSLSAPQSEPSALGYYHEEELIVSIHNVDGDATNLFWTTSDGTIEYSADYRGLRRFTGVESTGQGEGGTTYLAVPESIEDGDPRIYKVTDGEESAFIPPGAVEGLAWDGKNLWGGGFTTRQIWKFDGNLDPIRAIQTPPMVENNWPRGLAHTGDRLWASTHGDLLHELDPNTGDVLQTFALPKTIDGLTWDGERLWGCHRFDAQLHVLSATAPPTPNFSVSTASPRVGDTVEFRGQSTAGDAEITERQWSFGDGSTATGRRVSHQYDSPGEYDVVLEVSDQNGASRATSSMLEVSAQESETEETPPTSTTDESSADSSEDDTATDTSVPGFGVAATLGALSAYAATCAQSSEKKTRDG